MHSRTLLRTLKLTLAGATLTSLTLNAAVTLDGGTATFTADIAIGQNTVANWGIAIGSESYADSGVAIWGTTTAGCVAILGGSSNQSVAIAGWATDESIAIGGDSIGNDHSISLGSFTNAIGHSVGVGNYLGSYNMSVAVGESAIAESEGASVGFNTHTTTRAVALGFGATAATTGGVSIGYSANSVAFGHVSLGLGSGLNMTYGRDGAALGTISPFQLLATDPIFSVANPTGGSIDQKPINAITIYRDGVLELPTDVTGVYYTRFQSVGTGSRTITIPAASGTLLLSSSTLNAANITSGQLPASVLPSTVSQLGATVELNSAEVTGQLAWSQVAKTGSSLADLGSRAFSDLQGRPTTQAGYGITDGISVARNTAQRITTAIRIEPQGDISMGEFTASPAN